MLSDGIVILGAGLAGLSAASHLRKGFEVFEASDRSATYSDVGMQTLVDALVQRVKAISYGQRAEAIDTEQRTVVFSTGYTAWYDSLISTIPLPELVRIIKGAPGDIVDAALKLGPHSKDSVPGIMDYLNSKGIISIGRLGAWDEYGMDDAIMEGRKAALAIS